METTFRLIPRTALFSLLKIVVISRLPHEIMNLVPLVVPCVTILFCFRIPLAFIIFGCKMRWNILHLSNLYIEVNSNISRYAGRYLNDLKCFLSMQAESNFYTVRLA